MTAVPTIDYTNKDFQSLRQAMLDLARQRLPEWTDRSQADLGVLLVDLFAYMGDIILYYQDRIANESFLQTALERRSVLNALRLVGYELSSPPPAQAQLDLYFNPAKVVVTIPEGKTVFSSAAADGTAAQRFEYLGPSFTIDLSSDQVKPSTDKTKLVYSGLPVTQCSLLKAEVFIGSSSGEPNQIFPLPDPEVILDTLLIEVNEGVSWVAWDRRGSLLYDTAADGRVTLSNAEARDYYVQYDENDVCSVIFGDGTYGRIPKIGSNNIRATYRTSSGAAGNVPTNTITDGKAVKNVIDRFASVTNPAPAVGGADHEDIDHAKSFGPLAFRSGQRAVTLGDYIALAQQAGGVSKVRGAVANWNVIKLYVAPTGATLGPVPETLQRRLLSYFEDKRMAGTMVEIHSAKPVSIDVGMEIVYDKRYQPQAVQDGARAAVANLLAFANVDFGQTVYLSDIYGRVEAVPGVTAVTVDQLSRQDSPNLQISDAYIAALAANLPAALRGGAGAPPSVGGLGSSPDLAALLRRALKVDVDAEGRIVVGEFEIPVLGNLTINLTASSQ